MSSAERTYLHYSPRCTTSRGDAPRGRLEKVADRAIGKSATTRLERRLLLVGRPGGMRIDLVAPASGDGYSRHDQDSGQANPVHSEDGLGALRRERKEDD